MQIHIDDVIQIMFLYVIIYGARKGWRRKLNKIKLGNTGLEVTELCFGALPIGPAQRNTPHEESAKVMALALKSGITFFDTAQMYRTYEPIAMAMKETGIRPVISTKSAAASYEDMDAAVKEALTKLDVEYIDIFFIHAARAEADVFEQRAGALQCLLDYKKKGVIGFIGISAHAVDIINKAAEREEIDIVFVIINMNGMGILRGTKEEMERATEYCFEKGKGVMLMKVLAGGNILKDYVKAMEYAKGISKGRAVIALGMVSEKEVKSNVDYFSGKDISEYLATVAGDNKNMLVFKAICTSCRKCAEVCHSEAVTFEEGPASIDAARCLKCGYCVTACPQFALRFI